MEVTLGLYCGECISVPSVYGTETDLPALNSSLIRSEDDHVGVHSHGECQLSYRRYLRWYCP